ncbi:MAG: N-carbamoylputrescine amidase [Gaiellaceae bacterium]|nr:N-carbamoylputrescine amidase [Gaiellaceae bacterium]
MRIAVGQFEPRIGEKRENVVRTLELIDEAAERGAELVVLPELCNSGYMFASQEEAESLAEPVPDGPTVAAWLERCATHGIVLVAGIAERDGDLLYNSAVVLAPNGHIGTFRKLHLWNEENRWFAKGDRGVPVFDTPVGRIATIVCYDGWFPECYRLAALGGADLVCIPTNWVPIPGQAEGQPAMATILCQAAAHSNSIIVAAADRIGVERGQPFIGQSVIVSHTGWPLSGPASVDGSELLVADVDLDEVRRARQWNQFNDPLRDRRPDTYGPLA